MDTKMGVTTHAQCVVIFNYSLEENYMKNKQTASIATVRRCDWQRHDIKIKSENIKIIKDTKEREKTCKKTDDRGPLKSNILYFGKCLYSKLQAISDTCLPNNRLSHIVTAHVL
jgi:hypothetical protein